MKVLLENLSNNSIFKKEDNSEILYVIPFDLPDFKITFDKDNNILKISSKYEKKDENDFSKKQIYLNLEYSIKLPENVTEENIKALKNDDKILIYIKK